MGTLYTSTGFWQCTSTPALRFWTKDARAMKVETNTQRTPFAFDVSFAIRQNSFFDGFSTEHFGDRERPTRRLLDSLWNLGSRREE
jgi:hypothetical protein